MLALFGMIIHFGPATADMPMYADDEEFKHCTKITGDWDNCVKEEGLRTLDEVKRLYRSVLSNPAILKWHKKPEENSEILRDMYESWTAFRNRLCMLSYRASMYIEPLFDERYSCNLYYTQHHKDHMGKILELMEGKAPEKVADFNFLKLTYHDEEYKNFSRIPVYKGEESDYITGYVLRQEILERLAEDKFDTKLGELARPILSFSEDEDVSTIWEKLLEKKEHISIIIDEYGTLRGIVTLEDVIETMLGFEIVDEKDEVVDMQELAKAQWKQMQKEQHK